MIYVQVTDEDDSEVIEIPSVENGTLLIENLLAHYPGACGLKYRFGERYRVVHFSSGVLYPPENGWGDTVYYCAYPKDSSKKKTDDALETHTSSKSTTESIPTWVNADLLVVQGLSSKTTDDTLHDYFSKYGNLQLAQVIVDPISKKSKGYGFIRFVSQEAQVHVMNRRHIIDDSGCDLCFKIPDEALVSSPPTSSPAATGNSPTSKSCEKHKKTLPLLPKTTEVRKILDKFIKDEVPTQHRHEALRVLVLVIELISSMENDYENKMKKKKELEAVIIQRSMIELSEILFLRKSSKKDLSSLSRDERWHRILSIDTAEIRSLKERIKADSTLTYDNFPQYVVLAYDYLSARIHRFVNEERRLRPIDIDDLTCIFVGWPAAKRALRLLLLHCFSPSTSPENSIASTPDFKIKTASKITANLKPVHIIFKYEDFDETKTLAVEENENSNVHDDKIENTTENVEGGQKPADLKRKSISDSDSEPEEQSYADPNKQRSSESKRCKKME